MTSAADFRIQVLRRAAGLLAVLLGVTACGGGGGGGGGSGGGSGAGVTISGKITFDRVPFKTVLGTGLNFNGIVESPARNVVVDAVQPGNVLGGEVIIASTTTDAAGDYALQVPANTTILIRAKAQMLKTGTAPTWNFRVLNNTNNDALYVMDGTAASSGSVSTTRNLRATPGWGVTSYTGTRAAAPFAILDTIYQVKGLILSAKADTAFPPLDLFWSSQNRNSNSFCPGTGNTLSSLYLSFSSSELDDCGDPAISGIYILGEFPADSDEFDQHVVAHEAGHYFEDRFARSDSIGGQHDLLDKLDLRVAFGEGWGNAFGAMALNDPIYRDSRISTSFDSGFNLESQFVSTPGWFSEVSAAKFLWDVFDAANESTDSVALGFGPIYDSMVGAQSVTNALTGVFPFATALKVAHPTSASGIQLLLAQEGMNGASIDEFGFAETNNGGDASVIPVYNPATVTSQVSVCSTGPTNGYNKLGNRKFLRLTLGTTTSVSIVATGSTDPQVANSVAALDPDILVWKQGAIFEFGISVPVPNEVIHRETLSSKQFPAGEYVIEIYDSAFVEQQAASSSPHCMTVSIAG